MKIENDASVVAFAKMQVEGIGTGLEKHNWMHIIWGRARDLYGDTLHPAQAFTKTITEDETGRLLFKAARAAPGNEVAYDPRDPSARGSGTGDESSADDEMTPEERDASLRGPWHVKLHLATMDRVRRTGESYPRASSAVYSEKDNAALRAGVTSEHNRAAMARMGQL